MHIYYRLTGNDRYCVSTKDEKKMERLADKLNYPIEYILRAVQEVGFDEEEVEEYIRDRYNRC
jgi:hypothetical protein